MTRLQVNLDSAARERAERVSRERRAALERACRRWRIYRILALVVAVIGGIVISLLLAGW